MVAGHGIPVAGGSVHGSTEEAVHGSRRHGMVALRRQCIIHGSMQEYIHAWQEVVWCIHGSKSIHPRRAGGNASVVAGGSTSEVVQVDIYYGVRG